MTTQRVTEHALVRYFERILGYNLEEVKDKILTEEIKERIETIGDGDYFHLDHCLIVRNGAVVTIRPTQSKRVGKRRRHRGRHKD